MFTSNRRHFETEISTARFHQFDTCTTCGYTWGKHSNRQCPDREWTYNDPYPSRGQETQNTEYVCG